jgi:hypothetical protein
VTEIHLIVEGVGEESAAPSLVSRILKQIFARHDVICSHVYNARGNGNLTRPNGVERFLNAARRQPNCRGVIVLLDAEEAYKDCPPSLACNFSKRAAALNLPFPVAIVCAVCEYESWFLYSDHVAEEYLKPGIRYSGDPEQECSAKGWLERHMKAGGRYREVIDQKRMTSLLELEAIRDRSRSPRRMIDAVGEILACIDEGRADVTPACETESAD